MSSSEIEKQALEHEAAKLFLRLYERQFGVQMRHIWHNQPAKPDISCYMEVERLDIEIAHLYASEHEAMAVLGRTLSLDIQRELANLAQSPLQQQLHQALCRLLSAKAQKQYDSERVWLVIRNASTLWHSEDILKILNTLHIPSGHPFEQVWIVLDWQGEAGIAPVLSG